MMPPMDQWGRIFKDGRRWTEGLVKLRRAEGGGYELVRANGSVLPGIRDILDEEGGFRIKVASSTSGLCTWVPKGGKPKRASPAKPL